MSRIPKITGADADAAHAAAQRVVEIHRELAPYLRPGLTLADIDRKVSDLLASMRCKSCFYGYRAGGQMPPFPSQACLSVNECVVHGTAGYYTPPLKKGDVLKIDIGVMYQGWVGDAAWTYVFGEPTPEVRRLMDAGKRSLAEGVKALRVGRPLLDWAATVERIVEREAGLHLVRGLGGHGYGRKLHTPPHVSNNTPRSPNDWTDAHVPCPAGMLVAVEPMIAVGTGETLQHGNTWPIFTADGSMSVHYEHDVLVTESGPRILTDGLQDVPDVVDC